MARVAAVAPLAAVDTENTRRPYAVVRRLAEQTDSVLVGISGGKDSAVTLDLCARHFKHLGAFFYYIVPGLSFQEEWLRATEHRYGITVHRRPHFQLATMYRLGGFRPKSFASDAVPPLKVNDVEADLRARTGIEWIVSGERQAESLQRRGMLSACGGLDAKRRRAYPIAFWPVQAVRRYIKWHGLALSADSVVLGRSFGDINSAPVLKAVAERWPEDFNRIREHFPHVEAVLARERFFG